MKPVFDMKGDAELTRMLDALAKISSRYSGAYVPGRPRLDWKSNSKSAWNNNAEIAQYLREQGRNFFETEGVAATAAQAFAGQLEIAAMKAKKATSDGQRANLAGQVWIAAMKAAMERATTNINMGTFEGGGSHSLSPEYAARKQKNVGFTMPIGKATGALLNNLSAHAGNIKLRRAGA